MGLSTRFALFLLCSIMLFVVSECVFCLTCSTSPGAPVLVYLDTTTERDKTTHQQEGMMLIVARGYYT